MKNVKQIVTLLVFTYACALYNNAYAQPSALRNAAESLQQSVYSKYISANGNYFIQNNGGNTNFNYWWNANALDALTDGFLRTRQDSYRQRMKTLLLGIRTQHGGTYINDYYDDMEWLALACLKAYEATNDVEYYNVALLLWQDILTGRSPEYGGSVTWNKGCHPSCKNAISNSPAALIGARLYRINNNAQNLQIAREIHAFVKSKLVDPATGAVWDSHNPVNGTTNTNPDWVFSYNLGMYIAASAELYKMTGEQTYLNDAVKSTDFVMNNRMVNGVLFTNETGQGDGGLFKGIFIRCLVQLARESDLPADTRARYYEVIRSNAHVLINQGTNTQTLVGTVWNVAPATSAVLDHSTQLSGIMLLEAAAAADEVRLYQHINYGGYTVGLGLGSYTLSNLVAEGAFDNDITAIAVPPGYQITIYENDNFSGASAVISSNRPWLAEWNDRISSVVVGRAGGNADITDLGGTMTAQYSDSPAGEGITNLIDNRVNTKYLTVHNAAWVQYQANANYRVTGYAITAANDFPERDPLAWTLQGSTDGISWTTIDSRTGEDFPARFYRRTFSFANSNAYRYYRFNLSNNSGNILQLAEIELLGTSVAALAMTGEMLQESSLEKSENNLTLFPNPVRDAFTLHSAYEIQNNVYVTDAYGKQVFKGRMQNTTLNVSALPSGVYLIHVIENGRLVRKRFVKE